jgi:LmbE family N-acetylglucosaminyl deacetylase
MLVMAPHPDDEILGAGGTMARFSQSGGEITVLVVSAHMPPLYAEEVHERTVAEARNAHAIVGVKSSVFLDNPAVLLRDVPLPELHGSIVDVLAEVEPDILFIPFYDRHVDHRVVFDAAMVAARPIGVGRGIQVVAAYETVSETHWNAPHVEPNFAPNWCVEITDQIEIKLKALAAFGSQIRDFPAARSIEAVRALALFRGSQAEMGYAEAFQIVRMTASPDALGNGARSMHARDAAAAR